MWGFPGSFSGKLLHPHFERVSVGEDQSLFKQETELEISVNMFKTAIESKFSKFNMPSRRR